MKDVLIVNADDWGGGRSVTDAIHSCFRAGAITSTSGMVHMDDSQRAAELALAEGLPVGLHLNLTQPFSADDVPAPVRARQERLVAHFANLRKRRWSYDPRVRSEVAAAVREQFDEFDRLYGRRPTHMDSHHHVHVCPDVLLSGAIPPGIKLRTTLTPMRSGCASLSDVPRFLKHAAIRRRFRVTDAFLAVSRLCGRDGPEGLRSAIDLSREADVEVMVHPSFAEELPLLLSPGWRAALAPAALGSYSDLSPFAGPDGDPVALADGAPSVRRDS